MVLKVCGSYDNNIIMARWLSWLERRPVTAEVVGSNPIRVVLMECAKVHFIEKMFREDCTDCTYFRTKDFCKCGYGGIGRHKRLKISREQSRAGSSPATRIP